MAIISELPGDVLCYMFSMLTLRDGIRARSLSASWRELPDDRTALVLDDLNVLGWSPSIGGRSVYQSKFVKAVDEFLETWKDRKTNVLKVRFGLGKAYTSHIDSWIASAVRMEVEELTLNLWALTSTYNDGSYAFPCHLLISRSYLKHLCLECCSRLSLSSGCSSWLSQLTLLSLTQVPLHQPDMDCILSSALNLRSLSLDACCFDKILYINIRLVNLKKLVIRECLIGGIELNCPNLEILEYVGLSRNFTFSDVRSLGEMQLWLYGPTRGCSLIVDRLTTSAPQLRVLRLLLTTEVQPLPVASNFTRCCLKRLDLLAFIPCGFDVLTITYLLNASPFLEELHMKFGQRSNTKNGMQRVHPECPHLQLKEVKITGFSWWWNGKELAQYLLRNATALKQMVIVYTSSDLRSKENIGTLLQDINPMVDLVIL